MLGGQRLEFQLVGVGHQRAGRSGRRALVEPRGQDQRNEQPGAGNQPQGRLSTSSTRNRGTEVSACSRRCRAGCRRTGGRCRRNRLRPPSRASAAAPPLPICRCRRHVDDRQRQHHQTDLEHQQRHQQRAFRRGQPAAHLSGSPVIKPLPTDTSDPQLITSRTVQITAANSVGHDRCRGCPGRPRLRAAEKYEIRMVFMLERMFCWSMQKERRPFSPIGGPGSRLTALRGDHRPSMTPQSFSPRSTAAATAPAVRRWASSRASSGCTITPASNSTAGTVAVLSTTRLS